MIKRLYQKFFLKTPYQKLGGQKVISQLVDDFYRIMQTDPYAKECLATHEGRDIKESGEKLKAFLSGWLGGPQQYLEKYGHPRLRMRHFPFSIGSKEADQWLYCMRKALENSKVDIKLQSTLIEAFSGLTNLVKNRDETN